MLQPHAIALHSVQFGKISFAFLCRIFCLALLFDVCIKNSNMFVYVNVCVSVSPARAVIIDVQRIEIEIC